MLVFCKLLFHNKTARGTKNVVAVNIQPACHALKDWRDSKIKHHSLPMPGQYIFVPTKKYTDLFNQTEKNFA